MTTAGLGTRARTSPADQVAPVRQALLSRALADADRARARATADVDDRLAAAEERAATAAAVSTRELEADLEAIAAQAGSLARRQARAVMLATRRAAYERLRTQARAAVRELTDDPGYPDLLARLTARAQERLGPGVAVREHPHGGVEAEAEGRRLALTLDAAADRAVDGLGDEVALLWTP